MIKISAVKIYYGSNSYSQFSVIVMDIQIDPNYQSEQLHAFSHLIEFSGGVKHDF